jgi:hypothetical protein
LDEDVEILFFVKFCTYWHNKLCDVIFAFYIKNSILNSRRLSSRLSRRLIRGLRIRLSRSHRKKNNRKA